MGDLQCGLCLSCGVPFKPDLDELDYYNRQGTLSLLFLQTAYVNNRDIRRMFKKPKFISGRHEAHVFHTSHVAPALKYMCERHTDDSDVGILNPAVNTVVADADNEFFLYYRSPASVGDKRAEAASWVRPTKRNRINMKPLLDAILAASAKPTAKAVEQNLEQTYTTCAGCNYVMTQLADSRFLLGYKTIGRRNTRGTIIQRTPIKQFTVNPHGNTLEQAYGTWAIVNNPAIQPFRPLKNDTDSDDPFVAYYLHQCLPRKRAAAPHDIFHDLARNMRGPAKTLYLEQCWIVFEIACLSILLEEGNISEGNNIRSHGMHQHLGALDFYVSFFLWRLMEFEYGRQIQANIDFVQWHQKFYWEAMNCKGLFNRPRNTDILGRLLYRSTQQSSRDLVEQICKNLMRFYNGKLRQLIRLMAGFANVPAHVRDFFVPLATLRTLRLKANMTVKNDFQTVLNQFGVNALMFRITRLCMSYPDEFKNLLYDFTLSIQQLEVERIRTSNKGLEPRGAYNLYYMCTIQNAPMELPASEQEQDEVFAMHDHCSHWASVVPLDRNGAFRQIPAEMQIQLLLEYV